MLFKKELLRQIGAGTVTMAFRRWRKPATAAGRRLRTEVGVLAIRSVAEISAAEITDEDAAMAGLQTADEVRAQLAAQKEGQIYRIAFELDGRDPRDALRNRDAFANAELAALLDNLTSLDRRSKTGRWVRKALQLIRDQDGCTAAALAAALDLQKPLVKARIRKLKELGLTESLPSGYRLSRRGRRVVPLLRRGF